ncbi:WD40-repeat-containing domain protein [Pelagophyceae sp. CCMP2097]|nr:WD40-repeat-containing domain protein [Pelagophyceae sp. CCMP2097]
MHAALRAAAAAAETAHANVGVQIFHHAHAGRINAVAAHPTAAVAASVGVDRTLRLWDCAERRLSQLVRLPDRATALAFHPDGRTLALGCDKGELVLLTCEGASPARGWTRAAVADLKYSADGKVLAVACADKCIYIFAADAGYKRKCVLKGHSVAPTRLDFDVSGRMLQSNDLAREVLFWDVQSGKQLTNAFALRNTQWATWTCPLGWPVQAVSDGGEGDGAAPEALAAVVARSGDSGALVSPGAANQLRLLSYPALRGALAKHYACHRDAVSGLAFTAGDERVVSAGGKDATLAMWRHT